MRTNLNVSATAGVLAASLLISAPAAAQSTSCAARDNGSPEKLAECVTLAGVGQHQAALQSIADANNGTRVSCSPGYDASVQYVQQALQAAGYVVTKQDFQFQTFIELAPSVLEQVSPAPAGTIADQIMSYSGSGDVTAPVTVLGASASDVDPGCQAAEFAGFPAGNIALIRRSACTFAIKALPIASMAGILLLVAFNLIDVQHMKVIARTSRPEAGVLAITFLATLFVQLEFAIYVGAILSLLLYLNRTSHPSFVTLVPDTERERLSFVNVDEKPLPECPQLKIMRIDGSIYFGAVEHVANELEHVARENPEQAHILIVGGGINFIDVAGCQTLNQEAHRLRLSGRQLYFCSLKEEVTKIKERGGCTRSVGEDNIFRPKTDAIGSIVPRLDPERCRYCTVRVFRECTQMPDARRESPTATAS